MDLKKKLTKYELVRINLQESFEKKYEEIKQSDSINQKVAKLKALYFTLSTICTHYEETKNAPLIQLEKLIHNLNNEELKAHIEHFDYNFEIIKTDCKTFWKLKKHTIENCNKLLNELLTRIKNLDIIAKNDEAMDTSEAKINKKKVLLSICLYEFFNLKFSN
jgi:hypothetical protein